MKPSDPRVERVDVLAYRIPTSGPESDGTMKWDTTTVVVVEAEAEGSVGIGYSYTHTAAAELVSGLLRDLVEGRCALDVTAAWEAMKRALRNVGRSGLASTAVAAVDAALWDLKARLLDQPLPACLDAAHHHVPVYGSGGFTSYTDHELRRQLEGWQELGIRMFKMKVGRAPDEDLRRVAAARAVVGDDAELFVDANGALGRKQALRFAEAFADHGVSWFEEPVSSDDLEGLRLLRDRAPAGMEITAGEYGYDLFYFRRMLDAGAVDCLQADATRCEGPTGFLRAGTLCDARSTDLSAHTAPSLHAHLGCSVPRFRHVEYFHDHARIEEMLFDGCLPVRDGHLEPDRARPGNGLTLKREDAAPFLVAAAASDSRPRAHA